MTASPLHRLQGWVLATFAELTARSARYQVMGSHNLEPDRARGPRIIASWHGMTMMLSSYLTAYDDPRRGIVVVPDDSRGATLSVWLHRMGATPIAVSMEVESLVAARRLLEVIRLMKPAAASGTEQPGAREGMDLYLNPDGPDGPTHEPKAGVLYIARKTGAQIIPVGAFTATCFRIPRWDRYVVPFPYSRIAIVAGERLVVDRRADLEEARAELRARLNDAELQAERLYRTGSVSG